MPWNEVTPMDEKVLFIADDLRDIYTHSELCRRYGISRKTGYKWLERYRKSALAGLEERSRRPHDSPSATPYAIRKAIIDLRRESRVALGAKKIRALLLQRFPDLALPSKSTIYNILNAEGLVEPQKRRRRISRYPHPLAPAQQANDIWSVDYKGQFQLGSRQWCYPLTVMDHYSRYLLGCHGSTRISGKEARACFVTLFREYGLPQRIRSDNGPPFASNAVAGLSSLSVWWIRLGILPERIEPGKPQQNGRHERMHRTLKQATLFPISATLSAQQRRFDAFRHEYNYERPHEALKQTPPAAHFRPSPRVYPSKLPDIDYPAWFVVKRVGSQGTVYAHNGQVYVSNLLAGEHVGMEEVGDGIWDIYFGPVRLGGYDIRDVKGGKTPYWTIKV